ncbi:signal peptide peptidase SppA [Nocardioides limicola]|uniref:signal peptide peptidase SppA n=1 Tax=Nocardioides limicola TaxID=2803368 RepID=UPI00193B8308|nr:signal peptide peptidase SppA [Nocardioides sp. DJM-14]
MTAFPSALAHSFKQTVKPRLAPLLRRSGLVDGSILLELDLSRGVHEAPPASPLAALKSLHTPVLRAVIAGLDKAAEDKDVVALIAHLGTWQPSLSESAELRDAVARLTQAGKRTVIFAESFGEMGAGNTSYHLASAFEQIWLQPSGDLGLVGMTAETTFLRGTLDKIGVQPQIGQRHEYKTAANTFTETTMTEPQREMMTRLVTSSTDTLVADVAASRGVSEEAVRAAIEEAPLSADEAKARGLIDEIGYRADAYAAFRTGDTPLKYLERYAGTGGMAALVPPLPGRGKSIVAVVHAAGPILLGRGNNSPFSSGSVTSEGLGATLRAVGRNDDVRAVVLRIDSPGGSYVASDALRREILGLREAGKTVVASMGSVAASGGYYLAMPCERILASPGTITGSIGVLAGKQVLTEGLARIGITREAVSVGRYADMFSSDRPFTDDEWARLDAWLDRVYDDFTTKAATDRSMPVAELREVAKGRVWTGADAHKRGLVDALGGLSQAIDTACELAGVDRGDADVRVFPRAHPLEMLRQPENSESPAAARLAARRDGGLAAGVLSGAGWASAGWTSEGFGLFDRLVALTGVPAYGALSLPFQVRLR